MTPNPNRIQPLTPANAETDARLKPIVQASHYLPPWVTAGAFIVATVAAAIASLPSVIPGFTLPVAVSVAVYVIGAIATATGFAGPGLTKKAPPE